MIKELEEELLSRLEDKIVKYFSCDYDIASEDAVEMLGLLGSIRAVTRWNKVNEEDLRAMLKAHLTNKGE